METLSASDVILGLVSFIMLLLSGGVKMLWNKVGKNEDEIKRNREQMHKEMEKVYTKHDNSNDKLRTEINNLATSIRSDMAEHNKNTTTLLLQIAGKNGD
jgi:ABC-type nickel/cobalt efflux system permease component RcnA